MNLISQAKTAIAETPKRICEEEFLAMVMDNPSIFKDWEIPLEITEFVDCSNSKITHLSPLLRFTGRNNAGNVADFSNCKNLENATGTFHGHVCFFKSGIKKIEELIITKPNHDHHAAGFSQCKNLEVATGKFPGHADFSESGIHTIHNLEIERPEMDGHYGSFYNCPNLKTLEGRDPNKIIDIEISKLQEEVKRRKAMKKFIQETQPQELPFL
jgi:hypothetical protein